MYQLTQFAQSATYNCSDSADSTYGAGGFGACDAAATTTPTPTPTSAVENPASPTTQSSVGAPDTGTFQSFVSSGSFSIVLAVALAVIITAVASVIVLRRKKS